MYSISHLPCTTSSSPLLLISRHVQDSNCGVRKMHKDTGYVKKETPFHHSPWATSLQMKGEDDDDNSEDVNESKREDRMGREKRGRRNSLKKENLEDDEFEYEEFIVEEETRSSTTSDRDGRARERAQQRMRLQEEEDYYDDDDDEYDDDEYDDDEYEEDYDDDDDEVDDLLNDEIIPNTLLDQIDPDGAIERFPELVADGNFWRDSFLFTTFCLLIFLDQVDKPFNTMIISDIDFGQFY